MSYSTINKKIGDCCQCPRKAVHVIKVKKDTICYLCNKQNKAKQQLEKQKANLSVRSLIKTQDKGLIKKITRQLGISSLIQDLDAVVSKYIRIKYSNVEGELGCFTCYHRGNWKTLDCGHFINREHLATRFLESNLRPQCHTCNRINNGNIKVFAERLEKENNGITDWLAEQARIVTKPTQSELKELLIDFRAKLKIVESKLQILNK